MKKLFVMLAVLPALWLVGCNKDQNTLAPVASEAGASEALELSAARYGAVSDSVTAHHCKGKLTEVAAADLSAAISSYITTNYTGASIKYAGTNSAGKTVVALVLADGSAKGLLFNADGSFAEELKAHAQKAKLTEVELSTLPSTVGDYIALQYRGYTAVKAGNNALGEYLVLIASDDARKVLLFDSSGTFSKELDMPVKHRKGRK